jgi:hypothetical protein
MKRVHRTFGSALLLAAFLGTAQAQSIPVTAGLVSLWSGEGNPNDVATGGNHGTWWGSEAYAPGQAGQAFSFNGASAVTAADNANLNFGTGDFSGSLWVKTTAPWAFLIEKDIPGVGANDWFVHLRGDGRVRFVIGPGGDPSAVSSVAVNDGLFHHVAWVRQGTTISVYIDGALSGQGSISAGADVSNGVRLAIGAEVQDFGNFLTNQLVGAIDEVALYGRALTPAEIQALYTGSGVANNPPNVSAAAPSIASIWPPNNKMVNIAITGVTDQDGDAVSITITGITNNETGTADASGVGTSAAQVKATRLGKGSGRTYTITFVADDGKGGSTSGSVTVVVAHDQGKRAKPTAIESATWGEVKNAEF